MNRPFLSALLLLAACGQPPVRHFDLLIRGGTVYDGTGAAGQVADVAISTLMGDDVEARKRFIQTNAKDVRFIDI